MKIIEELRESREQFRALEELLETSEFLREFPNSRITYDLHTPKFILSVAHDYAELVETMKQVKKIAKDLKFDMNWFSSGVMLFSWKSELVHIWFRCYPDQIPEELMPSSTCKVVKTMRPVTEEYQIVCEVSE